MLVLWAPPQSNQKAFHIILGLVSYLKTKDKYVCKTATVYESQTASEEFLWLIFAMICSVLTDVYKSKVYKPK